MVRLRSSPRKRGRYRQQRGETLISAPASKAGWDPLVRLTHWGIAATVVANGLLSEDGSAPHVWIGYAAGALLAVRLLWGLVGTRTARFSSFPPSARAAIRHIRDMAARRHVEHRSHNPLGALMVYALWATLTVVVASGVAMDQGLSAGGYSVAASEGWIEPEGSLSGAEHEEEEHENGKGGAAGEMIEEVHEIAANLLFLLAALHVAGVAFESRRVGGGLVGAMITGRGKPRPAGG